MPDIVREGDDNVVMPVLPLISDPHFYAVAIPAVLLMGTSKAGFGSGFGALAVPLMALAVPVPQAAAILLPLLLAMDTLGLLALINHADRRHLRRLIPAGLLGTGIGTLLFKLLDARTVAGIVGGLTLLFLAQRLLIRPAPGAAPPTAGHAWFFGAASGFTSFVAHAGGPPISFYLLPLRLTPLVYTGTAAVFFAVINASKWLPYAWLGLLDLRNFATSAVLLPFAALGVWIGLTLAKRIEPTWFYRLVYLGMAATGIKLLSDALR